MRKFILWVQESFEEKDGRTSSKRLTAFWFNVLVSIDVFSIIYLSNEIVISELPNEKVIDVLWLLFWVLVLLVAGILLMYKIINLDQASSFARAVRGNDEPQKESIVVKTETVSEIIPPTKDEKAHVASVSTSSDIG